MKRDLCFIVIFFSSLFLLSGCFTQLQMPNRERSYESVTTDSAETTNYQSTFFQTEFYPFPYYRSYFNPWYQNWYYDSYWSYPWRNNGLFFGFYWNTHQLGIWNHWYNKPYIRYPNYWLWPEKPRFPGIMRTPGIRTRDNSGERGFRDIERKKPEEIIRPKNPQQENKNDRIQNERKRDTQISPPTRNNTNTERQRENTNSQQKSNSEKRTNTTRGRG